jgi:hypothetical protein
MPNLDFAEALNCEEYGEQNAEHTIEDYSQSGFAGDCGWYQILEV